MLLSLYFISSCFLSLYPSSYHISYQTYIAHLNPRSFPTRRSSDLTLPVCPAWELSLELEGSHFRISSSSPSPSRSPTITSLALYSYSTPSGVVPPSGLSSGTSIHWSSQGVNSSPAHTSCPSLTTATR